MTCSQLTPDRCFLGPVCSRSLAVASRRSRRANSSVPSTSPVTNRFQGLLPPPDSPAPPRTVGTLAVVPPPYDRRTSVAKRPWSTKAAAEPVRRKPDRNSTATRAAFLTVPWPLLERARLRLLLVAPFAPACPGSSAPPGPD